MEKFRFFVNKELKARFVELLRHQTPQEFVEELRTDFLPTPLVAAFSQLTEHELDIYMDYAFKYQGKRSYLTDERAKEMLQQMKLVHPYIYKIVRPAIRDCSRRLTVMSKEANAFYELYLQHSSDVDWESNDELRQYFILVLGEWTHLTESNRQEFAQYFPNIYKLLTDKRLHLWTGFKVEQIKEDKVI